MVQSVEDSGSVGGFPCQDPLSEELFQRHGNHLDEFIMIKFLSSQLDTIPNKEGVSLLVGIGSNEGDIHQLRSPSPACLFFQLSSWPQQGLHPR